MLRQIDAAADREMTLDDRIAAFERIESFAPYLPHSNLRDDDDQVTQTWIWIRARYAETHP